MTASRALGLERNIPESTLLVIDSIHDKLEILLDTYSLECDFDTTRALVLQANRALQALWKFDIDDRYDTWSPKLTYKHFASGWVGRSFECVETGTVMTIPEGIHERQMIYISDKSSIDLGVCNGYHRKIGNIREVFVG